MGPEVSGLPKPQFMIACCVLYHDTFSSRAY